MGKEMFIKKSVEKYKEAMNSYPYNINIIDELHASENAHSRILDKLLQYKDMRNQTYPILESFFRRFNILGKVQIQTPKFQCEKSVNNNSEKSEDCENKENGRIDLYIEDREYTIIFENKINGAPDQAEQLKKYIDYTKKRKENYFVFYLSKSGDKPTDKSLSDAEQKKLENENRLHLISYQQDILYWLEDDILPYCTIKEEMLTSALRQYIDYLKGLFLLRTQDKDLKETMKIEILKLLEIDTTSNKEKIEKLYAKINEIEGSKKEASSKQNNTCDDEDYVDKIVDILKSTRTELVYDYFSDWKEKIKSFIKDKQNLEIEDNFKEKDKNFGNQYPRIGIKFKYNDIKFCCIIETNLSKNGKPYIVFWTIDCIKKEPIKEFLERNINKISDGFRINDRKDENSYFYTSKRKADYDEIYGIFEDICQKTIEQLNEES